MSLLRIRHQINSSVLFTVVDESRRSSKAIKMAAKLTLPCCHLCSCHWIIIQIVFVIHRLPKCHHFGLLVSGALDNIKSSSYCRSPSPQETTISAQHTEGLSPPQWILVWLIVFFHLPRLNSPWGNRMNPSLICSKQWTVPRQCHALHHTLRANRLQW